MSAVSQSATIRFFGVLKNLFSKPESNGNGTPGSESAASTAPAAHPVYQAKAPARGHYDRPNGKAVVLPLQIIVMGMSQELRAKVRAAITDDLTISIPLEKIISQLGRGTVKIPFGDIRRSASHVFATGTECDHLPVALPLSEILLRINPSALIRRPGQKQTELSNEVTSPFGAGGQGLVISDEAPPKPALQKPPIRRPLPPMAIPESTFTRRPMAPPLTMAPRVSIAAAPSQTFAPATPIPAAPQLLESRPIPMPSARPVVRAIVRPAPQSAAAPASVPASPIAPEPAVSSVPALAVNLAALSESWPEKLRQEIVTLNLASAQIALPVNLVEAGLKRGRVAFPWKIVRGWMRPALAVASVHDETELDLPLKVLAPMFFAEQKAAANLKQQKVAVDESIPNLFFGFPQPEPVVPDIAPAIVPAEVQAARPIAAAGHVAKPAETNYYVWNDSSDTAFVDEAEFKRKPASTGTDFVNRYATPNEIVSRAAALDGVVGAVIALPDGLMVANKIPDDLNGDTLAAFLPQLFSKMSQCTKELRMGELNNLNFTVGNIPWKIFRVNAVFFAAFGRAGESLPTGQLAALAGELDRKNK